MIHHIEKIVRDTVPEPYASRCLEGLRDFLAATENTDHPASFIELTENPNQPDND